MNCATPCAPGAAYRHRVEPALLPDQPGEKNDRQIIFLRCSAKRVTEGVDVRNIRCCGRRDRAEFVGLACSRWPKQPDGIESDKQPDQAEYETGHVPSPLQRR
jgi:hypothetical protein